MNKKNIIKFNDKEYQLSTVKLENFGGMFETMVFPIIDDVVSGEEVFKARTFDEENAIYIHDNILKYPSVYLNKKVIEEYVESKEKDFLQTDFEKFKEFFDEMNITYKIRTFNPVNKPSVILMSVCDEHYDKGMYSASLDIRFDKESGKFMWFEPYGE